MPKDPRPAQDHEEIQTMSHTFSTRHWVPVPLEAAFLFFADPRNLPRLMPPNLETRIERLHLEPPCLLDFNPSAVSSHGIAGIGSEILFSFRPIPWLPWRLHWLARITEFEWNDHFCDQQVHGPFASFLHRHGTVQEIRYGQLGTLVTDDIEFTLPFGFGGRLAAPLVRQMLERSFAERQSRLTQLLLPASRPA